MAARKSKKPSREQEFGVQRLQRVMAAAGIGSRRECELIIQEGRVEVDGEVVAHLGVKVDPSRQEIYVDAERLQLERLQYFMLNKPPGVVSTSRDPSGRARVIDLIQTENRVYNVGRLDRSSEGLILVTNDGDLANRLTHPRYGVAKKYHVQVSGIPAPSDLKQLKQGIFLAEGKTKAVDVKFLRKVKNSSWLEITLDEGRNREIRRMLAAIGHKVRTLRRVSIGPLRLKDLPVGAHRELTGYELRALKRATSDTTPTRGRKKSTKKKRPSSASGRKAKPAKRKSTRGAAANQSSSRSSRTTKKSGTRTANKKRSTSRGGKSSADRGRGTKSKRGSGVKKGGRRGAPKAGRKRKGS